MRLHILSVIFVACAMLSFGGVVAPERAMAQQSQSCPAADASITSGPTDIGRRLLIPDGGGGSLIDCFDDSAPEDAYDDPTADASLQFTLLLPGNRSRPGASYPAKILARDAAGTVLSVTNIICDGATIGGIGSTVGTIQLAEGESCELYVFWDDGNDDVSFSGGTLELNNDIYSITESTVSGGQFGGTATTQPAIDVQRNNVYFDSGDTDDLGTQTAGTPVTLTYTIESRGSGPLTVFFVESTNEQNLQSPVTLANPDDSNDDLGTNSRQIPAGDSFTFTATFTPTDPTDFSFQLTIAHSPTPAEALILVVSGSASSSTSASQVIARTQRIISNFMGRRAAQIVGKEPDLTKRLSNGGNSSSANGPVSVTGEGTANNNNLALATSLRQVIGSTQLAKQKRIGDGGSRMALGARQEGGSLKDGPVSDSVAPKPRNGFGLWTEGTWARVDDDTAKSDFGLLYVGADYRFNSGLVVGVIAQFDRTDEEDDTNDYAIEGKGWMAGPYVVARIGSNLIFDARAAWGK